MIIRRAERKRLKPECVDAYVQYHQNIWPELEKEFKERGIQCISVFLNGCEMIIYTESDDERFNAIDNPIEQEWWKIMDTLADLEFNARPDAEYTEKYRFEA